MKKLTALIALIMVTLFCVIPVYAAGVYISSQGSDKISLMDNITIGESINGNVISVLGDVTVNEVVNGQVIAVFGDVYVNSLVSGQVVTIFGNTHMNEKANVTGDVITIGSLHRAKGSNIGGQEVRIFGEAMNLDISSILYLRLAIMMLMTFSVLAVGLVLITLQKKKYKEISGNIDKNLSKKLLMGVLSFLAVSIMLILLVVTLIAPFVYIIILILSTVAASMLAGKLILNSFSQSNSVYMEFITGLITISLVKLLVIFAVPQSNVILGLALVGIIDMLIYSAGLGVLVEKRFVENERK